MHIRGKHLAFILPVVIVAAVVLCILWRPAPSIIKQDANSTQAPASAMGTGPGAEPELIALGRLPWKPAERAPTVAESFRRLNERLARAKERLRQLRALEAQNPFRTRAQRRSDVAKQREKLEHLETSLQELLQERRRAEDRGARQRAELAALRDETTAGLRARTAYKPQLSAAAVTRAMSSLRQTCGDELTADLQALEALKWPEALRGVFRSYRELLAAARAWSQCGRQMLAEGEPNGNCGTEADVRTLDGLTRSLLRQLEEAPNLQEGLTTAARVALPLEILPPNRQLEFQQRLDRLRRPLRNDDLSRVAATLNALRNSLFDWSSDEAQMISLQDQESRLARAIERLRCLISNDPKDRYVNLGRRDREFLASRVARSASGVPFRDLLREGQWRLNLIRDNAGEWAEGLQGIVQALEQLVDLEAILRDDRASAEERQKELILAIDAAGTMQYSAGYFSRFHDPKYDENLRKISKVARFSDPDAAAAFADFRKETLSAGRADFTEAELIRIWFGTYIDRISREFSYEHLLKTLDAAIALGERQSNEYVQIARRKGNALRKRNEVTALERQVERTLADAANLEQATIRLTEEIANAGQLTRYTSSEPDGGLDPGAVNTCRVALSPLLTPSNGRAAFVGAEGARLRAELEALDRTLRDWSAAPPPAPEALTDALRLRLSGVLRTMPLAWNRSALNLGSGRREERAVEQWQRFTSAAMRLSAQALAGLHPDVSDRHVSAGSAEVRLRILSGEMAEAPRKAAVGRRDVEGLRKSSRLGWWNVLQLAQTAFGLATLGTNVSIAGSGLFGGNDGRIRLDRASGIPLLLGAPALGANTLGGSRELRSAFVGSRHAEAAFQAAMLDPDTFRGMEWELLSPDAREEPGYVYFRTPVDLMRSRRRPDHYEAAARNWKPADPLLDLTGRFYVMDADRVRRLWPRQDRLSSAERAIQLRRSADSALLSHQIQQGWHSRLVPASPNAIARYLSGLQIAGTLQGLFGILDSRQYRSAVRSPDGGFVNAASPRTVATIRHGDPAGGRPQVWVVDSAGQLYAERRDEKGAFLDAPDGTVKFQLGAGRPKFGFNLRRGFWFHRSDRVYIPSLADARRAESLPTAASGTFFRRRQGSAAVRRSNNAPSWAASHPEPEWLETVQAGRTVLWKLGEAMEVNWEGQPARVRPFYTADPLNPDFLGVILLRNGELKLITLGKPPTAQVDPATIFGYVPAAREQAASALALLGVEPWTPLEPRVQAAFARAAIPPLEDENWEPDLDGQVQNGPWITWTDQTGRYFLKTGMVGGAIYRLEKTPDGPSRMLVRTSSLPELAKLARLDTGDGAWFLDSEEPSERRPLSRAVRIDGRDGALAWMDLRGTIRAYLPRPSEVGGVRFPRRGTWVFRPGLSELRFAREQIDALFCRRQLLPLTPDLEARHRASGGSSRREERVGLGGRREIWYTFDDLAPDAAGAGEDRELVATFVSFVDASGRRRAAYVRPSLRWLRFQAARDNPKRADPAATRWQLVFWVPPGLTWYPGTAPASLGPILRDGSSGTAYAYDVAFEQYYVRLTPADGVPVFFRSESSWAGDELVADNKETGAQFFAPLAEGLPASLVATLPGMSAPELRLRRSGSGWEYLESSIKGTKARLALLEHGHRFAEVLEPRLGLTRMRAELERQGYTLHACGRDDRQTIPYGGMSFRPYLVPSDPDRPFDHPSMIILEAAASGTFRDPEADGADVELARGQIVVLGSGSGALQDQRKYRQATQPYLRRQFLSVEMIHSMGRVELVAGAGTADSLPGFLGVNAASVSGRWHQQVRATPAGSVREWAFFEVGARGGSYVDRWTGRTVRLEPGSVWQLVSTTADASRFTRFHAAREPAWALSLVGAETLLSELRARMPDAAPDALDGSPFTLSASGIRGKLHLPLGKDFLALEVEHGGRLDDPFLGDILVSPGSLLVYQQPLALQEAIAKREGPDPLFLPTPLPYALLAPFGMTRGLVAGELARSLLPGLPPGTRATLLLNPEDAGGGEGMLLQIDEAPSEGVDWPLPGTRLKAGMLLANVGRRAEIEARLRALRSPVETLEAQAWSPDFIIQHNRRLFRKKRGFGARERRFPVSAFQGMEAEFIEDLMDPNNSALNPALNLVRFKKNGTLPDGQAVLAGVLYRRRPSIPELQEMEKDLNAWATADPIGPISRRSERVRLEQPVPTRRWFLDEKEPFTPQGTFLLHPADCGLRRPRPVEVWEHERRSYVVDAEPFAGAMVRNVRAANKVQLVWGDRFDTVDFGGIVPVSSLEPSLRARIPDIKERDDLVQLDPAQTRVVAQITLRPRAYQWLVDRQNGYGFVQMKAGAYAVSVSGQPRRLQGWVAIGDGPGALPFAWLIRNMKLDRPGEGWRLRGPSGESIGEINFGKEACRYWEAHPEIAYDPGLLGKTGAVYYFNHERRYITREQLRDLGSHFITVSQVSGRWVPLFWKEDEKTWYLVEKRPTETLARPTHPVRPDDPRITPRNCPHGLVDRDGRVIATVRFPNGAPPPGLGANPAPISRPYQLTR